MSKEVRAPQAGIWGFYPIKREELVKVLEKCFKDKRFGPGGLPKKDVGRNDVVVVGIAPHAGYEYSGPCAAWLYKEVAETLDRVDTVVIIGTNHTGLGGNLVTTTSFIWSTPLGELEVDEEFVSKLRSYYPSLEDDPLPHIREHSVEVQLPFLQYVYGNSFRIVPIVARELSSKEAQEFAQALYKTVQELGRRTLLIASTDFTHHGSYYGYVLFTHDVAKNVRKLDLEFIDRILALDTNGFLSLVRKYDATICGIGAIVVAMEFAKIVNAKPRLLQYYNSAELTGEEYMAVGYASIAMYVQKS